MHKERKEIMICMERTAMMPSPMWICPSWSTAFSFSMLFTPNPLDSKTPNINLMFTFIILKLNGKKISCKESYRCPGYSEIERCWRPNHFCCHWIWHWTLFPFSLLNPAEGQLFVYYWHIKQNIIKQHLW